ncbi:MAG: lytic transglycosylase domain-containing protein [Clostridiaceae bacterium]
MNNIKSTEDVLKYRLFAQLLKNASGDDDDQSFSAVMESAMSSLSGNSSNEISSVLDGINQNLGNLEYGQDTYENTSGSVKEEVKTGNSSIDSAINKASEKYNVDAKFIKSVIKQESNFNPNSVSSAGAMGLMQLMPSNAKYYGASNPYDVNQNVDAGTRLLKDYLNMYGDNKKMALAAYNAGPTRIKNKGVTDTSQFNKLPKETQNYVKKVMNYYSSQSNE